MSNGTTTPAKGTGRTGAQRSNRKWGNKEKEKKKKKKKWKTSERKNEITKSFSKTKRPELGKK